MVTEDKTVLGVTDPAHPGMVVAGTTPGLCECGCGQPVNTGSRYIRGHNVRGPQAAPAATAQNFPTEMAPVATAVPGVYIDEDTYVVLSVRLGRLMEELPKKNPNDPLEAIQYHTPEAFERGMQIHSSDVWTGPVAGYANGLDRLLRLGAICRLDHPDAATAIHEYNFRREQEAKQLAEQTI